MSAAQGTTDFGEYFLYFSFFLVVSALLLAYLFFAVGLEQRTTEVGVLAAMGYSPSAIRRVFIREGAILAAIGAVIGAVAAIGYSALILYGLRTWWVGAVGTTDLELHVEPHAGDRRHCRRACRGLARALARRARDEPPLGALVAERRCRRHRRGAHRRVTQAPRSPW